MTGSGRQSLRDLVAPGTAPACQFLSDANMRVPVRSLGGLTNLCVNPETLRGQSVMIAATSQLFTLLVLMELDGIARRVVLCTPDLMATQVLAAISQADIDVVISDEGSPLSDMDLPVRTLSCPDGLQPRAPGLSRSLPTEWVIFTSGTTGFPKLAVHSLGSFMGLSNERMDQEKPVWSTFYDIRRFGGLQVVMRALRGRNSMVFPTMHEPVTGFLERAGSEGVTHISGTPSHFRQALMSDAIDSLAPSYIRLGGEICDQSILDRLGRRFPGSRITHAFASTEAGVAFDVRDGLAGFPVSVIGRNSETGVTTKIEADTLRVHSPRGASRYLGDQDVMPVDAGLFVDTGDLVERRGDRYYFLGRRNGAINVGGLKVHPEVVEAVIHLHPLVHVSHVYERSSSIIGAIIVCDIVLLPAVLPTPVSPASIRDEVLELCRKNLMAHQVPHMFKFVDRLASSPAGKLARRRADTVSRQLQAPGPT